MNHNAITYGVALKEKPLDEGLTRAEVIDLFNMLHGIEAIPIEIQAENSCAMGFINLTDAEFLNYDYTGIENTIIPILNDMEKENPDCEYTPNVPEIGEISIWLSR